MKKLSFVIMLLVAGLLLLPFISYGSYDKAADKTPPPVSQALVREGDFAVKLVGKLGVVKTVDEGKAEEVLAEAGIAPKNGWISDFPVTPDVLAEIRTSLQSAAVKGRIKTSRGEANARLLALSREMGLPIVAASGGTRGYITGEQYGEEGVPTEGEGEYQPPTVVNNYYYEEGPPVVTYYPPPPDYSYLYAWNPFPFWWDTYFFPGFFVLRDFTTTVVVNNYAGGIVNINADKVVVKGSTVNAAARALTSATTTKLVSNRVFNRATNSTVTLDPVTRVASAAPRVSAGAVGTFNRGSARNILSSSGGRTAGSFANRGGITRNTSERGLTSGGWTRGGTVLSRNTASATVAGRGFDPAPSLRGRAGRGFGNTVARASAPSFTGRTFDPAPSLRGRGRLFGSAPSAGRGAGPASLSSRGSGGFQRSSPSFRGSGMRTFSQPAPSFSSSGRSFTGSGGFGRQAFGAPSVSGRPSGGGFSGRSFGGGFSGGFGGRSFGGRNRR